MNQYMYTVTTDQTLNSRQRSFSLTDELAYSADSGTYCYSHSQLDETETELGSKLLRFAVTVPKSH
jgi:hypothetical protein